MKKLLLTILAIMLACGVCTAQTKDAKPAGKSVYYASHSLMWDMPPVLTEVTKLYGIEGHNVVNIDMIGVSFTRQFWDRQGPDEQNPAKKVLIDGKLDAFVMSPIGMPDEAIEKFVKLGLEHNPNVKFYVQISWPGMGLKDNNDMASGGMMGGGRRGPGASGTTPSGATVTQTAAAPGAPAAGGRGGRGTRGGAGGGMMGGGFGGGFGGGMMGGGQDYNITPEEIDQINVKNNKSAEEQAKKINEEAGKTVIYLVPSAQAHNALRKMIYNKEMPGMTDQGEVFRDFIGHPTDPVIALNAYLHFAVMYGVSPVGLPIPSILKNSSKPEYKTEEFNLALQNLAWKTVTEYAPTFVKAPEKD
ncbi:MAG: hypothetical protein JXA96_15740 [Sedimentisphaerales bacterium]|nr:hypothetical protein [Sedimentisphaerales bacterium]